MKLKVQYNETSGTIFVTNLDMGGGGFHGAPTVEISPGQSYGTHPFRRLKRWCGDNGECEREVAGPELLKGEQVTTSDMIREIANDEAVAERIRKALDEIEQIARRHCQPGCNTGAHSLARLIIKKCQEARDGNGSK